MLQEIKHVSQKYVVYTVYPKIGNPKKHTLKNITKLAMCNYCISGHIHMNIHLCMHTNIRCNKMLQTVNSLGHYSFKHKSLGAAIPSFKKIPMFMWGNTKICMKITVL
jgi:hypothetical protein